MLNLLRNRLPRRAAFKIKTGREPDMVIIYASNTGNTEKYAKILQEDLDIPAYPISNVPDVHKGGDAIYLGWVMAGNVVGYKKISKMCNAPTGGNGCTVKFFSFAVRIKSSSADILHPNF